MINHDRFTEFPVCDAMDRITSQFVLQHCRTSHEPFAFDRLVFSSAQEDVIVVLDEKIDRNTCDDRLLLFCRNWLLVAYRSLKIVADSLFEPFFKRISRLPPECLDLVRFKRIALIMAGAVLHKFDQVVVDTDGIKYRLGYFEVCLLRMGSNIVYLTDLSLSEH